MSQEPPRKKRKILENRFTIECNSFKRKRKRDKQESDYPKNTKKIKIKGTGRSYEYYA